MREGSQIIYTYMLAQMHTLSRDVFQEGSEIIIHIYICTTHTIQRCVSGRPPDNIYVRVSLQSCAHCPEMCFCLYFYRIGSLQGDEKVGDKRLKFVELFF